MKFMRAVLWVMLFGAFLGFMFSFAMETSFSSRAQKVQVVRIDKTKHSPFGPVTIDVGDPAMLIVDDPKAFLKNKTATGLRMLDEEYVKQHGDGALQLNAMTSIIVLARAGCVLSILAAGAGLFLIRRISMLPVG
jgi:hypothetical protein